MLWVKLAKLYISIEAQERPSIINYIKYVRNLLINVIRITGTHVVSIFPIQYKERRLMIGIQRVIHYPGLVLNIPGWNPDSIPYR